MSFFYRGKTKDAPALPAWIMRLATTAALTLYPAGCVAHLYGSSLAGYGLMVGALIAFIVIAPSSMQRIVGEETKLLDEMELDLRRRAHAFAYQVFGALTLVGILYMGIASDATRIELWAPSTWDHWSALLWGAIIWSVVLPTAYLAWAGPAPVAEEE
ncbi:MAG: hypothetical protein ABL308_06305 [Oceanicaulis sp.]